jgi:hypothetical protein
MSESIVIPTWIAAFAAVSQALLLAVNAVFVWEYLRETAAIRKTAQGQLKVSQFQVSLSQQQVEAQIRPALTVRPYGSLKLVNVGNGAALNLRLVEAQENSPILWDVVSNISQDLSGAFVSVAESAVENAHLRDALIPSNYFAQRPGQTLQLIYESLSGKKYASVIEFSRNGAPIRTRFEQKE